MFYKATVRYTYITSLTVSREVLDTLRDGPDEIPLHPRGHADAVPPQVPSPEELGLEGKLQSQLMCSKLKSCALNVIICFILIICP